MTFAEKVKEARKQLGLSQEKFAGKMGVSFSTINRWEKGRFLPSYLAQTSKRRNFNVADKKIKFNT